ncbi:KTSC domain-containing protein [Sphingomonas sp. XMGL2]|uniref:KTSC domain-containing protein n=2 Tax=Sphingomonas quercus TaxID=2842451 RepID=A0ABS6BM49_9SPHN|nr:KTSC domain-containing protein [Sphingomonas quercus]MBU3078697.1 KTSC domain-containing protein [Sphingomonas quercus]
MPSSVIRSFAYDEPARRLDIEFVSGRVYAYHDVPPAVARAMAASGSRGGYFNRRIRDRYRFTRLPEASMAPE